MPTTMNYQSLPLIIGQLSAVDIVLLAVVVLLFLFGRKIPTVLSRAATAIHTVKYNVDMVRGVSRTEPDELTPAVRKRIVSESDR